MALTFKFDEQQLERLVTAINNLSENVAKWQGNQADATRQGFADLIAFFGGGGEDEQGKVNQITSAVKAVKDKLQTSVDSQN
jgi:hypothetical protein